MCVYIYIYIYLCVYELLLVYGIANSGTWKRIHGSTMKSVGDRISFHGMSSCINKAKYHSLSWDVAVFNFPTCINKQMPSMTAQSSRAGSQALELSSHHVETSPNQSRSGQNSLKYI